MKGKGSGPRAAGREDSTARAAMTSRERVVAALNHQEPDRVPLDLGGTIMSGIMAHPLDRLRRHLGLEHRPVRVYEVFQMLGEVEMDVVERLGIDVLPVEPPVQFFGLRREGWKPWRLWDGTEVLMPGQFGVEVDSRGDWLLHTGGDPSRPVEGHMPRGGYYFDMASMTDTHYDYVPPSLEEVRKEERFGSEELEFLAARAETLRRDTDKALLLGCWGKFGLPWVGSIPDFLMLQALDPPYVRELFAVRTETALDNLARVKRYLGDNIDILGLDGTDYGAQNAELFSPDAFEELYVPFFREQNDWVHAHTSWKTWLHTCGSVPNLLPMLVETGLDILNPVQTSAAGMDPAWLKERFGERLSFWGGGIDTQRTLPFGTPEQVAEEVRERIRIFAPGGGFVFNTIHNVQADTPPENIAAAYDTARIAGRYPVRPRRPRGPLRPAGRHREEAP
ncbi:MAG: methyltransferase [Spirochaetales bacterium]|nr:methyltransferase [Spirochaetales bacterium]